MSFTGKNLVQRKPGCDPYGFRRTGLLLSFFFLASLPVRTSATAEPQRAASRPPAEVFVGSVVAEAFTAPVESMQSNRDRPTVSPGGSATMHVSQVAAGQEVRIRARYLFRKPGRVVVRLPKSWTSDKASVETGGTRIFEVRAWPGRAPIVQDAVVAGAGALKGQLGVEKLAGSIEPGERVLVRLILTGEAAMAVTEAPELAIVAVDASGPDAQCGPVLFAEASEDWGETDGRLMGRTWLYEWHPRRPGSYRIKPLRFTHLDEAGRVQTRLVAAPVLEVLPRPLVRVDGESVRPTLSTSKVDEQGAAKKFIRTSWLIVSMLGIAGVIFGLRMRANTLAWSLRRALNSAESHERALVAWRAIEPAWRAGRHRASAGMIRDYHELSRRAFGRPERGGGGSAD